MIGDMSIPQVWNRRNRILLKELIKTDFKLRYQGSILGYLWAILRPMLMFLILYVVFTMFLKFGGDIPHYSVYLLTGTVLWSFFTECTGQGMQSILTRGDLLRKLSFPKWIIVVSATATALINLLINLVVVVIFALLNGVEISWRWLLVPLSVVELYGFSLSLSFLLGALNVKYRDVASIWEVVQQALFYAIPVIYPISMITETSMTAAKILMLNPIAQVIQDVRYNLITTDALTTWNIIDNWVVRIFPLVFVLALLIASGLFFRKKSKYFAEEI